MNNIEFQVHTDVHPAGAMPVLIAALSTETDSTALRAEYSLLISAFDFVCALREIALAQHPKARCQLRSVAAGN
jgi:hypothetical protein